MRKLIKIDKAKIFYLIYVIVLAVLSSYHEFWRDEIQAFMIAENSVSIIDLFHNSMYEGHPSLWFIVLFIIKIFGCHLMGMKIVHLCISAAITWLVVFRSPFKFYQKVLLLFGYLLFYEYGFFCRNYALGILFLFAFCTIYPNRTIKYNFIWLSFFAAGMLLSNFYSFFIAVTLILTLLVEFSFFKTPIKPAVKISGILIMFSAVVLFVLDTLPPADYGYASTWQIEFNFNEIKNTMARVFEIMVPIPQQSINFWNSNVIENLDLKSALGLIILILLCGFTPNKTLSSIFLVSLFVLILCFSYFKFNGYLRHNGHLWIGLVAMYWLQPFFPGKEKTSTNLSGGIFNVLIYIQVIAMPIALYYEIKYQFSQAKTVGAFISKNYPETILVGEDDAAAASISAYVDNRIYYPAADKFGTFIVWNQKRLNADHSLREIKHKTDSLKKTYNQPLLLIFNQRIQNKDSVYKLIRDFHPAIDYGESYYLYIEKK